MGMINFPGMIPTPGQPVAAPAPAPMAPDQGAITRRAASDAYAVLVRLKSDPEFYTRQYGAQGYAQAVAEANRRYQAATYASAAKRG
jgi:hypothetical protein